jgi:hypothetical protein
MKVLVCVLLALHLASADLCVQNLNDVNIADYIGKWYNYGRVNSVAKDVNTKCLYYDGNYVDGKYKFTRYHVDAADKEVEVTGYSQIYLDKGYTTAFFDNSDEQVDFKLLCLNPQFEISYFGDLSDG